MAADSTRGGAAHAAPKARPVKFAISSAPFAALLAAGRLTQLEWLDLCANELELDGVVVDVADCPRFDRDYAAEMKKMAADLGLTIAALAGGEIRAPDAAARDTVEFAAALGAPLTMAVAPQVSAAPGAYGAFASNLKDVARAAKAANIPIALRPRVGTWCTGGADLLRVAKDVDSAWIRFAFDTFDVEPDAYRDRSIIAVAEIASCTTFATADDFVAPTIVEKLARFRGFVVLEPRGSLEEVRSGAIHAALERFAALRAQVLVAPG